MVRSSRSLVRSLLVRAAPVLAVASALAACAPGCAEDETTGSDVQHETEQGRLLLLVTVDWEGRDLRDDNLSAMERLRERFPGVKLVQFLNAAYFTKPGAVAEDVAASIARALLPDDELGLHVHGWRSLFEASGVTFRSSPTFWDPEGVAQSCFAADCGHEVPISAYASEELRSVLRFSNETLEAEGFGRPTSFRAGGWMADVSVRDALVAEGFLTENSAVPAEFLASEIGDLPLHGWVEELWKGTTSTSQPAPLPTDEHGHLLEIPDNGALADYMTAQEMIDVYEDVRALWEADPEKDAVLSIGFHQETAARFLPRVEEALDHILADAADRDVPLRSSTAAEIAAKHQADQQPVDDEPADEEPADEEPTDDEPTPGE